MTTESYDETESLDVDLTFDGAAANLGISASTLTDTMEEAGMVTIDGDGRPVATQFAIRDKLISLKKSPAMLTQSGLKKIRGLVRRSSK